MSTGHRSRLFTAIAAAIVSSLLSAGPAVAQDVPAPTGWWQFDREILRANEADGTRSSDFLEFPFPLFNSELGLELALRLPASPGTLRRMEVNGSELPDHWSAPPVGGAMTIAAVVRAMPPTEAGREQEFVGRWTDAATGAWRLAVVPDGVGSVRLRAELGLASGVQQLELPLAAATWHWVFLEIDVAAGVARLEVRGLDGEVAGSVQAALEATLRVTDTPLAVGKPASGILGDVEVHVDVMAGWEAPLDDAARRRLVADGRPRRYVDVAGWSGFRAPARHAERLTGILDGDRRHIFVGDSFSTASGWNRVFPAILRVAPLQPLTGLAAGVRPVHTLIRSEHAFSDVGPPNPRSIRAGDRYQVEWIGGTEPDDVFGLPTNLVTELRAHPKAAVGPDGDLLRLEIGNQGMFGGVTGRFSDPGDRVAFRLVHRRIAFGTPALEGLRLASVDDAVSVDVDLTTGVPRQVATDGHTLIVETGSNGVAEAMVRERTPGDFIVGPERFANLVTVMSWRVDEQGERLPGQYYTSLHDESWTLWGFQADLESAIPQPLKAMSRAQLRGWLDATTLDPDQPITIWWYVDTEVRPSPEDTAAVVRGCVDTFDQVAGSLGLPRPSHAFVVPHLHQVLDGRTRDERLAIFAGFRDGIDLVADDPDYDHVARLSLFDATDGVQFDGRPESRAWLAERGYDAFAYRGGTFDLTKEASLLDAFESHPADPVAAGFFASLLPPMIPEELIEPPCAPADLNASGAVDTTDLLVLLAAWGDCPVKGSCDADFDGDGAVATDDLLRVLAAWGPCPQG